MRNVVLSIVALTGLIASAQVYIGDAFIYSKGTDIFVKQEVNISTDGEFYLRNEAHLLQEDNVPNEGPGILSVYQEGAANEYTYNYWGSPVGLFANANGNEGFNIASQTHFPLLQSGFIANTFDAAALSDTWSTNLVVDAAPATVTAIGDPTGLTDQQTTSNGSSTATIAQTRPATISGRWLYTYNNNNTGGSSYANWQRANGAAVVAPGYGWTMKGVRQEAGITIRNIFASPFSAFNGQRYDFRGRPNNGTIPLSVRTNDVAVVGNPYPSALDLKDFLNDNCTLDGAGILNPAASEIDPVVLFWESKSTSHNLSDYIGGYASYVPNGFAAGAQDGYATNGTYTPATYSRYNNDGSVNTGGSTAGGSNGTQNTNATIRRYMAIGQGFVIQRTEGTNPGEFNTATHGVSGTPEFRNSQRTTVKEDNGANSISFFTSAPGSSSNAYHNITGNTAFIQPKIRFSAIVNDLYVREFVLQFDPSVSMSNDYSWEAVVDNNKQVNDIFMPVNHKDLIINAIPFSVDKVVPISFENTQASTFEIKVKTLENFDTPYIGIHDTQTNTVYDIKNGVATITTPVGRLDNRYTIVFQDPTTLSNHDVAIDEQFDIVQNNNRQELTVYNPNKLDVYTISLFDMAGKQIFDSVENNNNAQYVFNTGDLSSGIYIVRLNTTTDQEIAIKVSVHN